MNYPLIACLVFNLALMTSAHAAEPTPYVLKDTDVVDVRATQLNRDYQLFVSLPPSYKKTTSRDSRGRRSPLGCAGDHHARIEMGATDWQTLAGAGLGRCQF